MPRAWGYIVVLVAVLVGAAALLLPTPERVEFVEEQEKKVAKPPERRPPKPRAAPKAAAPKPAKPKPPAPKPKFPFADTTNAPKVLPPKPGG